MTESRETGRIRLMLVDDHQLVRDGLRARLGDVSEICTVGEAGNAKDALALAVDLNPNLILTDVRLPDMSGIELTSRLVDLLPDTRIMILSMFDNREYVLSAIRAGACGYILKDTPSGEIISAIKSVANGGSYFSRSE
jgi:DNA-binding NarL/FixJ family response regulator